MSGLLSRLPRNRDDAILRNRWASTWTKHFRLMHACAEICQTAAHVMLLNSPHHKRIAAKCAKICQECAADCERLGDMQDCVITCRRCAESCRKMAA